MGCFMEWQRGGWWGVQRSQMTTPVAVAAYPDYRLHTYLREAQSRVEELEVSNSHLQRRLDKLKNAKSALLKEL
uniref:(California timema) hypothetical protein n=1 Tax=Timema californicum TaxID=61474 RepID=A0A7R9P9V4_TIMCA|nr:unnamed protein product [Timema californicum]